MKYRSFWTLEPSKRMYLFVIEFDRATCWQSGVSQSSCLAHVGGPQKRLAGTRQFPRDRGYWFPSRRGKTTFSFLIIIPRYEQGLLTIDKDDVEDYLLSSQKE